MGDWRFSRRRVLGAGIGGAIAVVLDPGGLAGAAVRNKGPLHIIAHADDTILFMNPDGQDDIAEGNPVRAVFLTAGENSFGASYWQSREAGVLAFFAQMAGVANVWTGSTLIANGHALDLQTLNQNPNVSVVFMRLPDGNYNGSGFRASNHESLQGLWTGTTTTMHTIDGSTSYTHQDLISTLASIMTGYQPGTIRTQDFMGTFADGDHSDHHTAGYFTKAANNTYSGVAHDLIGYMGYPSASQPANVEGRSLTDKINTFFAYAPYDFGDPQTRAQAESGPLAPYGKWFARQYTVASIGFRPKWSPISG